MEEGKCDGSDDGDDGGGDAAHLYGSDRGGLERHYLGGGPSSTEVEAEEAARAGADAPRRRFAFALPIAWPYMNKPRRSGVNEAPNAEAAAAAAALPPLAAGGLLFLCEGYHPRLWWWDVVEACRRVLMVAALPAVNRGTTPQGGALVAFFLALLFALAHSWVRPNREVRRLTHTYTKTRIALFTHLCSYNLSLSPSLSLSLT